MTRVHTGALRTGIALLCLLLLMAAQAVRAAPSDTTLATLASGTNTQKLDAIRQLGEDASPQAARILEALGEGRLRVDGSGRLLVPEGDGQALDPLTGERLAMPEGLRTVVVNNRLRRAVADAQALTQLFSEETAVRLAAAQRLQQGNTAADLKVLERALARENDEAVRDALTIAQARLHLTDNDPQVRLAAIAALGATGDASFRQPLLALLNPASGSPDGATQAAVTQALAAIDQHQTFLAWAGNVFYGLSLGSVLLLAALGLAITFGLMGVINMAHGELLMIGAYATYVVQSVFRQLMPAWIDWYVVAALPVAFLCAAVVGMVLERTVIRWLYGRPLETLLATWGISLILMQGVRSLFGAQNVEVANPEWMTGGVTVLGGLVLSYNRLAIIVFALLVVFFVWLLLNHTRLGLFVRAITQNRRMADCTGVPTARIDTLAFGLGAGIAGLGGVALSQLGNVGPDLGRAYIVDSFMVVVLGGVGQLAGTVIAAFGLGSLTKFLEPWSGAVLAKIAILVLIVLFVQKRPQGLFAPRGRSVE